MTTPARRARPHGGRSIRNTAALAANDARSVARDPLLLLALLLPLLLGFVLRWGFPWIAGRFPAADLWRFAAYATGFAIVQSPLLVGFVAGFMLLDERDEGVLAAIAVTPLGQTRFLVWRLLVPALASIPAIAVAIAIAGLGAPGPGRVAGATLLAAAEAPIVTLFLAVFAANKVEGLALAKVAGLAVVAPFAALLVPPPWHWVAGILPQFWPVQLFASDARATAAVAVSGAAVHAVWLIGLGRFFHARSRV